MKKSEVLKWIHQEFSPLELSIGDDTISQIIENSIRYLNTFSAFRQVVMVSNTNGTTKVQIPSSVKTVVAVYPNMEPMAILTNYPMWSLLGIAVLDNATSDLILMTEAFKNYKYYLGSDFRWTFEPSQNPSTGGYLYVSNFPPNSTAMCVVGTKQFFLDETNEITDETVLSWFLSYVKALVKMAEGNVLRKGDIIGVKNDGQELFNEGKEEKKDLENRLSEFGRWVAFVRRI
jgi:hypothetical protein